MREPIDRLPGAPLPDFEPPPAPVLHTAAFAALDPALPLALLPLRLEVRFSTPPQPPELRLRAYPDAIHADAHRPGLSATEQDLARAFWERSWRAGGDTAGEDAAFAWLAGQVGPWRAAWVARATAPTNPGGAPAAPVPDEAPLDPAPLLADVETLAEGAPTLARLLPDRLAAVGYYDGEPVGTWWGEPIPPDLALAPGLVDAERELDGRGLLDEQGLAWTRDFDEAVRVGMALRIDLANVEQPVATEGFGELIVLGVHAGDRGEGLEALLEAHRYSDGLDLIPQGTPTNATETVAPALHPDRPDLPALRASELAAGPAAERPALGPEGALYEMRGADAASVALGLGAANALDRVAHAGIEELAHAKGVNQTLWAATLGHYLDQLFEGAVAGAERDWLRRWSVRYVRGGGPLPTLLVGAQPYGLLPAVRVEGHDLPATRVEHVEDVIVALRAHWDASLGAVPRLDPDVADAAPTESAEGDLAATVSGVLGAVPHPTALRLRQVDDMRATYTSEYGRRLFDLGVQCLLFPDASGEPYANNDLNPAWLRFEQLDAELDLFQLQALESAVFDFRHTTGHSGSDFSPEQLDYYGELASFTEENLLDLVAAHDARVAPIKPFAIARVPSITGRMGDDDDPAAFFALHPSEQEWAGPLVAAGRSEEDLGELVEWIEQAQADLASPAAEPHAFGTALPLLRQLVRHAIEHATDPGDAEALAAGLETLAGIARHAADPVGELERLLRESLGTTSYRLDAWYTGVAAARLESKRERRASGIQVGAYGFLVDVAPRGAPASQGYVLAPSLSHATAAAVLRSGWSALGGAGESGGLAVDLSSDRVRRAHWLVDGVRRGQDLGELLGARVERGLHDAGLDAWIAPLREVALEAAGRPGPANAIVDGLLLARARSGADDLDATEAAARDLVDELLAAPDRPAGDPAPALAELVHDLDAAADAAVAQGVFSLVEGNVPEATATLTASTSGEIAFPPLRFADTPRPALTVTHRLVLLLDPGATGAWPGAPASGRALAAPALEAWVAGLLGDPARLVLDVRFDDGAAAGSPQRRTLADVGLAALDLVELAPAGEETGLGTLGAVLAAWAEGLRGTDTPAGAVAVLDTAVGEPSLDEVALAARSLRRLIGASRDLDGRDLAAPGATGALAGVDVDELAARAGAVRAALAAGRDALAAALPAAPGEAARGDVRAAMLALAGFQLAGGVPRSLDAPGLVAEGEALIAQLDARLAALDERVAAEEATWEGLDEAGRRAALAGRLELLIGHSLPLAPRFEAANAAELDASFARGRLPGDAAATGWLAAAGRVDAGARRLRVAVDMLEAVADATLFDFAVAQLPDHPGEGWAALERPSADERGRLCLLATGAAPAFAAGPAAGLVLGAWNESLPRGRQTAGVALHFDAPSSRAPQAVLLCTAEAEPGFGFELVRDTVAQTLALARLRTVGPETLLDLGQYLPASYLPGDLSPGEPA